MEKHRNRLEWLDFAKGVGILLVILGHALKGSPSPVNDSIVKAIYSFHMPMFFLLAGYVIRKKEVGQNLAHRIKTIGCQYIVFSALWCVLNIVVGGDNILEGSNMINLLLMNYKSPVSRFWFIPALIVADCIFQVIIHKFNFIKQGGTTLVLYIAIILFKIICGESIVLPVQLESALIAVLFMYVGFIMKQTDILSRFSKKNKNMLILVGILIVVGACLLEYYPSFLEAKIPYPVYFLLSGVFGSISVVLISQYWWKYSNFIRFIGKNSLYFYFIHSNFALE